LLYLSTINFIITLICCSSLVSLVIKDVLADLADARTDYGTLAPIGSLFDRKFVGFFITTHKCFGV
jgi:hypothetical protein